jgi:hypothetical protein
MKRSVIFGRTGYFLLKQEDKASCCNYRCAAWMDLQILSAPEALVADDAQVEMLELLNNVDRLSHSGDRNRCLLHGGVLRRGQLCLAYQGLQLSQRTSAAVSISAAAPTNPSNSSNPSIGAPQMKIRSIFSSVPAHSWGVSPPRREWPMATAS